MGVTYRATDMSLPRKVALKLIKTEVAERSAYAREGFVREARAAVALRHRNIGTVYQFAMRLETRQYSYAMELLGASLEERVHSAGLLHFRATIDKSADIRSREVFDLTNFVLAIRERQAQNQGL
jgi:serine/threonine protein kinase